MVSVVPFCRNETPVAKQVFQDKDMGVINDVKKSYADVVRNER